MHIRKMLFRNTLLFILCSVLCLSLFGCEKSYDDKFYDFSTNATLMGNSMQSRLNSVKT